MSESSDKEKRASSSILVNPPNRLKKKVGEGGFNQNNMVKAQTMLENNTVDFKPTAVMFLKVFNKAIVDIKSGEIAGASAISALLYPVMQLNAHGTMFHYPLITKICTVLVNFLEEIKVVDADVLSIARAFETTMNVILASQVKDENSAIGKQLYEALAGACDRYYKKMKISKSS